MNGLGDLLAWILDKLGIKSDDTCGCEERRLRLNEWFPFKR